MSLDSSIRSNNPTKVIEALEKGAQPTSQSLDLAIKANNTKIVMAVIGAGAQATPQSHNLAIKGKNSNIVNAVKNLIEEMVSMAEIRKNAVIISQASKKNSGPSFFKHIPVELQTKIAGLTGNRTVHDEKKSENIASDHLSNPIGQK